MALFVWIGSSSYFAVDVVVDVNRCTDVCVCARNELVSNMSVCVLYMYISIFLYLLLPFDVLYELLE